jgi:hypothetical protein
MGVVLWTVGVPASQLHAGRLSLLFLELKGLFQPNFQRADAARGRPGRHEPDVFFHACKGLGVFQVGNQEIPPHLRNLLSTERARQSSTIGHANGGNYGTHPAVTGEKISLTAFPKVTLLLMSARATLQRGWIPSWFFICQFHA